MDVFHIFHVFVLIVLAEIIGRAHATVQKFVRPYIRVDPNVGVGLRQHVPVHISMGKCGLHYGQKVKG